MKNSGKANTAASAKSEDRDDSLNLRYQDKAYNERFKRWRKQNRDSLGFYYIENPKRMAYSKQGAVITGSPEASELRTFRKVLSVLGYILIFRAATDIFFTYIFPRLLIKMGYEVHYSFFGGHYYENTALKIMTTILTLLIGRLLPTLILLNKLKIPAQVTFPMKVTNKPMFSFAIPAILLAASMCSALSFFHDRLMHSLSIDTARSVMVPDSMSSLVYFFITQIIFFPIISELCVHGAILQLTRQFGDGTALILTSLVISSSSYDITQILNSTVMALLIGYFVIRTGSVMTGIIMRIFAKMYFYALSYLDYGIDGFLIVEIFLCGTIALGLIGTVYFFINDSDSFSLKIKRSYLSFGKRALTIVTNIPLIVWSTISFMLMLWNLKFIG